MWLYEKCICMVYNICFPQGCIPTFISKTCVNSSDIQDSEFIRRVNTGEVIEVEIKGNQISGENIGVSGNTTEF